MTAGVTAMAQTTPVLPEGMEILTPEGVTMTTGDTRTFDMAKNIVVAGSKEKGYKTYFTAQDAACGEELWVTDGTAAGTKMVKDIYPGSMTRSCLRRQPMRRTVRNSGYRTEPSRGLI